MSGAREEPSGARNRRDRSTQIPILLYHRISRRPLPSGTWIHPETLAAHLDLLVAAGHRPLTAEAWQAACAPQPRHGESQPPEQAVVAPARSPAGSKPGRRFLVTFDDGTADLFRQRHILQVRGVAAVVFVPVRFVGRRNRWEWPLPGRRTIHLTAAEIRTLADEGWTIGAHGATHCDLTRQPADRLQQEMAVARRELEDLIGREVGLISYPYGRVNQRVAGAAQEAGFSCGFVVTHGPAEVASRWAVRRRPVYCIDTARAVLTKVADPDGCGWPGRWERWKEGAAHAVGRRAAGWLRSRG